MKAKRIIAVAIAAVISVSVLTATAAAAETNTTVQETTESAARGEHRRPHGRKEKVEAPENAIGKDAAKEAALKAAGLTAEQTGKVRSRLSETEDGTVVYKVRFSTDEKWYSYTIDALTGKVIDHTEQTAAEHAAAKEKAREEKGSDADADDSGAVSGKKHGRHRKPGADGETQENADASGRPSVSHGKNSGSATAEDQTAAAGQTGTSI